MLERSEEQRVLLSAVRKAVKDKIFVDALIGLGEEVNYLTGDEMTKYFETRSATIGKIMVDLAKESPAAK